ncbi:hypothetical protein B0H34DRAFT_383755 [Crassisporium funariophilum]|nr:hypothetical protein B0H34DRAFT_383755 [Crassisporium funariophilum]
MSPYPAASSPTTANANSSAPNTDATPKSDHRILIVVVVLGIVAACLIAFVIYITLRLKRRQSSGKAFGPYQGTVMHHEHPAAHITPFGAGGPHSGGRCRDSVQRPPGEDMRIAIRRPDGAWHFADSRTPFTPVGVKDIDVLPSPMSSSTSMFSFNSRLPSNKELEAKAARDFHKGYDSEFDFAVSSHVPPPPAYHREPCKEQFDAGQPPY